MHTNRSPPNHLGDKEKHFPREPTIRTKSQIIDIGYRAMQQGEQEMEQNVAETPPDHADINQNGAPTRIGNDIFAPGDTKIIHVHEHNWRVAQK